MTAMTVHVITNSNLEYGNHPLPSIIYICTYASLLRFLSTRDPIDSRVCSPSFSADILGGLGAENSGIRTVQ